MKILDPAFKFKVRSYVPGTREHEAWRETVEFLEEGLEVLREYAPETPDFPEVIRHPAVMKLALGAMMNSLLTLQHVLEMKGQLDQIRGLPEAPS